MGGEDKSFKAEAQQHLWREASGCPSLPNPSIRSGHSRQLNRTETLSRSKEYVCQLTLCRVKHVGCFFIVNRLHFNYHK